MRGAGNESGDSRWPTVGGLAAILLWSATVAVARSLSERVGPLTAAAAVYLLGGVACLAWSRASFRRMLRLPWKYVAGAGAMFVVYTLFLYLALGLARDREQALELGLVNYLWPALTVVFSLPLLGHRATRLLVPGTLLALAGMALVMTQGTRLSAASFAAHVRGNPAAFALALGAAVSWALYSNLSRRWAGGAGSGAVELFILATGLVLLVLRWLGGERSVWDARSLGEAVGLGLVTALAYGLWDLAMRRGNLLLVAAASYLTPLLSTAVSCLYLHVSPTPRLWTGCALLVAGSWVSWRSVREAPAAGFADSRFEAADGPSGDSRG